MSDTVFILEIGTVLGLALWIMYWLINKIPLYVSIPIGVILIGTIAIYKIRRMLYSRYEE